MAQVAQNNFSYTARYAAQPLNAKIYEAYLSALQLDLNDRARLLQRGLTLPQISAAEYATKYLNNSPMAINALGTVERAFALDGVAGFYWDEKKSQRAQFGKSGLLIPSRDVDGNISSLLLRDNEAKPGASKYIAFSTAGKPRGGRAFNTTHCPIISGKPREAAAATIRITEGVLKADVATALCPNKIYCLGFHGVNPPENLAYTLEQLQVSKVLLSFDQETTKDVIKGRQKTFEYIKELGYDVNIEHWDPNYKGIDDALLKSSDTVLEYTEDELKAFLTEGKAADPNNGEWIYVIATERMINVENAAELKKSQFADKFRLGKPEAVNDLISNGFPSVDAPIYWPGMPRIIKDGTQEFLNLWVPRHIASGAGDVSPWTEHLEYLLPKQKERKTLIQYIAHHIQSPGDKIHWTPIIQGDPGTGKTFITEVLELLLGHANVARPSNEELHELYTGWMKRAQIVVVQEIMAQGRRELMNKLKPLITDKMARVREMYKQPYDQPNRFNFMFFTNYEDALLIDETDRRYFVLKSSAKQRDPLYYERLYKWHADPQTPAALLHWAENVDMTGFLPKANAPHTDARSELINISRPGFESWICDGIRDNAWPFSLDVVSIRHLRSPKVSPGDFWRMSDFRFAKALELAGARRMNDNQPYLLEDRSQVRLWSLRRHEILAQQSKEQIMEYYKKWTNSGQPGGNPLEDMAPM